MNYITRTVWLLSFISLFTDFASEMLYPIMPVYLKTIGFSVFLIGILEGIAEAVAGLSKGYFGQLSDRTGKRVLFVQVGYTLSAISKPMLAAFTFPVWIFMARTLDRLGKGVRTGARDALLSAETTRADKAKVFGLHRSMDTLGAVLGPSAALLYLHFFPEDYKTLFMIAFIPGLLAVFVSLRLHHKNKEKIKTQDKTTFLSFLKYWRSGSEAYRKLVIGLLLFSLFNSSDVFLLLKAKQSGLDDTAVIGLYIFYNLIYALFAFPLGFLADKIGLKWIFIFGLSIFAMVYLGMAFNHTLIIFYVLFFLYGIFASATEGIAKAWISNITAKTEVATAIGTFSALQSLCFMMASSLTGFIWFSFGAEFAFITTALMTLISIVYFTCIPGPEKQISQES